MYRAIVIHMLSIMSVTLSMSLPCLGESFTESIDKYISNIDLEYIYELPAPKDKANINYMPVDVNNFGNDYTIKTIEYRVYREWYLETTEFDLTYLHDHTSILSRSGVIYRKINGIRDKTWKLEYGNLKTEENQDVTCLMDISGNIKKPIRFVGSYIMAGVWVGVSAVF